MISYAFILLLLISVICTIYYTKHKYYSYIYFFRLISGILCVLIGICSFLYNENKNIEFLSVILILILSLFNDLSNAVEYDKISNHDNMHFHVIIDILIRMIILLLFISITGFSFISILLSILFSMIFLYILNAFDYLNDSNVRSTFSLYTFISFLLIFRSFSLLPLINVIPIFTIFSIVGTILLYITDIVQLFIHVDKNITSLIITLQISLYYITQCTFSLSII